MKRREFITLLGGAAAAWPLTARAQQPSIPVIGFLHSATSNSYAPMTAALDKRVNEAGYIHGQNVEIEYRWAEGQLDRLPELAADLVRRQVSVIFTGGGSDPSLAAKSATSKIPIVFANGTDPVEAGLVASLNRPGGNITGITFLNNTLGPKEVEAMHELAPKAAVIAVLINPKLSTAASQLKDVEMAARALGLQVQVLHASMEHDLDMVFASLLHLQVGGLAIGADTVSSVGVISSLGWRHAIRSLRSTHGAKPLRPAAW